MDERPYTIDDLVAHERWNMRLVALVLVGAVVAFALRGRGPAPAPPVGDPGIGPVLSASR